MIDLPYISDHKELNCYFDSPKDLMRHLTFYYKDLDISPKGKLSFSIKFLSEALKPKIVNLDIKEKQMDKIEIVNIKIENMKKWYEERLV